MGFLDQIDDPNYLAAALGGSANAPGMPPPMPAQEPVPGAYPGRVPEAQIGEPGWLRPNSNAVNAVNGGPSTSWMAAPQQGATNVNFNQAPDVPPMPNPQAGPGPQAGPLPGPQGPVNRTRLPMGPQGDGVPMGPMDTMGQEPAAAGRGGLLQGGFLQSDMAKQLGINISPQRADQMKAAIAGGLGAYQPGQSKFGAFAGGVGGALKGEGKRQEEDRSFNQKAQALNFNQLSTTWNNQLKETKAARLGRMTDAQTNWLQSRANALDTAIATGGAGTGKGQAWLNTPDGRAAQADKDLLKWDEIQQKRMRDQWRLNQTPEAQQKKELEDHDRNKLKERERLYGSYKLDAKMMTRGQAEANPIDSRGMTQEIFDATVPTGAWYRNRDGKVLQRKQGPKAQMTPRANPQQQAASAALARDQAEGAPQRMAGAVSDDNEES